MRSIFFVLFFLSPFFSICPNVRLYFQKALTGKIVGNPIIDEKRNTITVLTQDRWLITYTMSLEEKYSYRLNRAPYSFLLKDFDNGYYVITIRNEVKKIKKGKLVWRYKLNFPPVKAPAIANNNILIPLFNERVIALSLESGNKVFEVNIDGRPVTSPVILDNDDFCVANENEVLFSFDSLGKKKWTSNLVSIPNVLMINTNNELIVGHKSGYIVAYEKDFGEIVNSVKLTFPIHFLFEKFNGEYIAISNIGVFFNLSRNFDLNFKKIFNIDISKSVLYNNKDLFISTKSKGILSLDENFNLIYIDNKIKEISGLSANSGIIVLGGYDWVLSTYYYKYEEIFDVKVWNHFLGNNYNQGRVDLKVKSFVDYDQNYSILDAILDSQYSIDVYKKFLGILDLLSGKHGRFPKKYLNLYKKAFDRWLSPKTGVDRIVQRGEMYKYFMYINDENSIKNLINLAIKERNINNIINIVKTIAKFEYYHGQDCIIYNYIQYIVLNYQGNLELAYSVLLNLRNIALKATSSNSLKNCKDKYISLLKFMRRQNFSENVNKYINEILSSIQG